MPVQLQVFFIFIQTKRAIFLFLAVGLKIVLHLAHSVLVSVEHSPRRNSLLPSGPTGLIPPTYLAKARCPIFPRLARDRVCPRARGRA